MKQVLPWLWDKFKAAGRGIKRASAAVGRFLFPARTREQGWLSWKLYPATLIPFCLLEIGFIITIEVLLHLSRAHEGFVTVKSYDPSSVSTSFFKRSHWTQSYLWTTLPTFFLSLYAVFWTSVVTDFINRQPFIELAKAQGSTGRRSVLLDYQSYFSFLSWIYAFRNRHVVLAFTMLASFLTLILPSIISNLFSIAAISQASSTNMFITSSFNDSAVDSKTNYQTVFNIVSAARIYNSSFPPWTTENYSFPTFKPDGGFSGLVNASLPVTAYSANMDCQNVNAYDYEIINQKIVVFNASDRGCPFSVHVPVAAGATIYFSTNYIGSCNTSAGLRRHVFIAGIMDDSSPILLTSLSFFSCTVEYFKSKGNLVVSSGIAPLPVIVSFTKAEAPTTWLPILWDRFEFMIHQISEFDPTATYSSDNLGLLILDYSETLVGLSRRLDTEALVQATQDIFQSIFAVTSTIYLFQPQSGSESPVSGQIYSLLHRLFVVTSTARLLQGIASFLAAWTVVIMIYAFCKSSVLKEEPKGLLGIVELMQDGNCGTITEVFRNQAQAEDKFETFIEAARYGERNFRTRFHPLHNRPQISCEGQGVVGAVP